MPALIRLYIQNVIIGFGLSGIFVASLLWLNVANLWHLISTSQVGWIAALMLFVFNGIVFAGVQFAIVVMRMGRSDDQGPRGPRLHAVHPAPVPVEAKVPLHR